MWTGFTTEWLGAIRRGGPLSSQHAALVQHDGPARSAGRRLQQGEVCGEHLCTRYGRLRL
eukprot:5477571-Pleurochrysis_carterae.AAC.1